MDFVRHLSTATCVSFYSRQCRVNYNTVRCHPPPVAETTSYFGRRNRSGSADGFTTL